MIGVLVWCLFHYSTKAVVNKFYGHKAKVVGAAATNSVVRTNVVVAGSGKVVVGTSAVDVVRRAVVERGRDVVGYAHGSAGWVVTYKGGVCRQVRDVVEIINHDHPHPAMF